MRKSIRKPFEKNELIEELKKEFERLGTTNLMVYDKNRKDHLPSSHIVRKQLGGLTWEEVVILCGFQPVTFQWSKEKILSLVKKENKKLTYKEIKNLGISASVIKNHFKTFKDFYEALGWKYEERPVYEDVTNDELLKGYEELSKSLGKPATLRDLSELSEYPSELYRSRFGTVSNVRKMLGYDYKVDPRTITKEMCMREMLLIYENYGRVKYSDLEKMLPFHSRTMLRKFGTTSIKQVWKEVTKEYEKRKRK